MKDCHHPVTGWCVLLPVIIGQPAHILEKKMYDRFRIIVNANSNMDMIDMFVAAFKNNKGRNLPTVVTEN